MSASHPLASIAEVLHQPWRLEAKCLDADPAVFFGGKGSDPNPAFEVCARCPVRVSCREHAIRNDERWGVWGGMTPRQRHRERVRRGLPVTEVRRG